MTSCSCPTRDVPSGRSRPQIDSLFSQRQKKHHGDLTSNRHDPCQFVVKPHFEYYRKPLPPPYQLAGPKVQAPACFTWTKEDLDNWLICIGLGRYRPLFEKLGITGRDLAKLGAHDYRRMGISNWTDCLKLEETIRCASGRKVEINKEMLGCLPYPYFTALYFDPQDNYVDTARQIHRLPVSPDHTRDRIWRTIYSTAGDRFFYVDNNRPVPTI